MDSFSFRNDPYFLKCGFECIGRFVGLSRKTEMKTYILIADSDLTFERLQRIFEQKFKCYVAVKDRLTIENSNDYAFIDFDDNMKNDYEEPRWNNHKGHFFALLYHSEEFAGLILSELKSFSVFVDNDEGSIIPIREFLGE